MFKIEQCLQTMRRDGRIVWTELSLRAWIAPEVEGEKGKWKLCRPDVFSIRNSSRQEYLEPMVHEIKVSRADLLGDLKNADKCKAYLDIGGQCWYVLGSDAKGRAIGEPDEIPMECGVMWCRDGKAEVLRAAQKRMAMQLPFSVWMALAKTAPQYRLDVDEAPDQGALSNLPLVSIRKRGRRCEVRLRCGNKPEQFWLAYDSRSTIDCRVMSEFEPC